MLEQLDDRTPQIIDTVPADLDPEIPLSDNALTVLRKRYLLRGSDGQPAETPAQMFWRVARTIAAPDAEYADAEQTSETAHAFYDMLTDFRFMPNSPTFTGAGTPLGQLAACFVLPIEDDMGRDPAGIFSTLRVAALIQQTGGGNGFSFSRLRPKGARVSTSKGVATGPVGFLRVYDKAFGEIAQGGSRRGANMSVLRVDHPDILDFIRCKGAEGDITNFNISVGITDEFMRAVEADEEYDLINPQDGEVWQRLRARQVFDEIVKHAHRNGEPGILFLDAANRSNPVSHLYDLEATNPCVTGDTLVASPQGWRKAAEIQKGNEIFTIHGIKQVAKVEVNHAMPVYLVRFSDGGAVRATASHQFHVRNSHTGQFHPRRLDSLQAGAEVRVLRPVPMPAAPELVVRADETSARVLSITPDGIETVYDLYEPETDTWITDGYVSRGCGEQFLGPYENCCLGSVNLAKHMTPEGGVDWPKLRETVERATHFLDNVVDANQYVPAVPEIEEAALRARRIGLGIMGLGDLMFRAGIRYGSPEGEEFAAQVMEFVRFHAMRTSVKLAETRGPFPVIEGSLYGIIEGDDPEALKWRPPSPVTPYAHDFGRPDLDWGEIVRGIRAHGIRNAATTTVAPTGTIATVSGCEAYGCEPAFALAYVRHFKDGDQDVELTYTSPLFLQALEQAGLDKETRQRITQQVTVTGSCQAIDEVPEEIRRAFVVANDLPAEEHVRMQAAIQAFVDNSISKTINFPEEATPDDVARAYHLAWRLGCKGLTVYVTGSREKVVLETQKTRAAKEGNGYEVVPRKPRPTELHGTTYRTPSPLGTAYITINENGDHDPFEVFANVGKAGSDTAAVAEAIGRLISLALRMPSPLSTRERLTEVIDQLAGIGGGRPMGFGPNRVRSLPDAIAQVLARYLALVEAEQPPEQLPLPIPSAATLSKSPKADLCPDCGQAAVVAMEGCRKCVNCGYSEC